MTAVVKCAHFKKSIRTRCSPRLQRRLPMKKRPHNAIVSHWQTRQHRVRSDIESFVVVPERTSLSLNAPCSDNSKIIVITTVVLFFRSDTTAARMQI